MTNEMASIIVGNIPINGDECYSIPEYQQAKAMAIKALEQKPCEDCISRQAVNDGFKKYENDSFAYGCVRDYINKLPSVTPKEKTGHWKEVYAETDYRNGWIEFSCENCEYQHGLESGQYGWSYGAPIPWKYCPICGARMVEPQESEYKE